MGNRPSVIFFGNPDFAIASLGGLLENEFDVRLVVTSPDRPAGRKLALKAPLVKEYALRHDLPVAQPAKLDDAHFVAQLAALAPDFMVVVAFKKLPKAVWTIPTRGTINVHPSLLPDYRGAAPIHWAIINGETESGISIIRINEVLDSGDIIHQIRFPIASNDDYGAVYERCKIQSAKLLVKTMTQLWSGEIQKVVPQEPHSTLKKAPKILQADCLLDFDKPVSTLYNQVRGLSPYPTAFTYIKGVYIKVFTAAIEQTPIAADTPAFITDYKTFLKVKCKDGFLHLLEVQAENKKRMHIQDFLRGWAPH